jgi:hypothetical protein
VSSIDITMTGAAGAAPTPAVVVRPCAGPVLGGAVVGGAVRLLPPLPPQDGTSLPAVERVRAWTRLVSGISFTQHRAVGVLVGDAPIAQRTTSSIPGDLPPRDPLS